MEVLVALAILGFSLSVIMVGLTIQATRAGIAAEQSEALQLAKSILVAADTLTPIQNKQALGVTDGYVWRIEVRPWGTKDDMKSRSLGAHIIVVKVSRGGRSVELSAVNAGP